MFVIIPLRLADISIRAFDILPISSFLHRNEPPKLMFRLPFDIFSNRTNETGEEFILNFKENGDCFFLNENNGDYSCRVYESRSEICRKYPSMPSQNDVCNSNRGMAAK
jgi:Fe-S-cluster containining protein